MTTSEVIQTIIYLGGLSGVVYWAGKWFHALKGAIEAQKTTIGAQQSMIEGMANFMNIVDAPKMAERYEAYRKIVDQEKDAILKQMENQFEQEKKSLLQSAADLKEGYEKVQAGNKQVIPLYAEAILKLAFHYKLNAPEWAAQKHSYKHAVLVESIEAVMDSLPAPPPPPKTPAEIFWEEGKKFLTQRALESKKDKPE